VRMLGNVSLVYIANAWKNVMSPLS
jgi:hypothetical protein